MTANNSTRLTTYINTGSGNTELAPQHGDASNDGN